MKKKKGFFINIAIISLCLCMMVGGVYAAKSAQITVSGTVGFTVHDCTIKFVSCTLNGSSHTLYKGLSTDNRTAVVADEILSGSNYSFDTAQFNDDTSGASKSESDTANGGSLAEYEKPTEQTKKYVITLKNVSGYTVTVTRETPTIGEGFSITSSASTTSLANDTTMTLTITLKTGTVNTLKTLTFTAGLDFRK